MARFAVLQILRKHTVPFLLITAFLLMMISGLLSRLAVEEQSQLMIQTGFEVIHITMLLMSWVIAAKLFETTNPVLSFEWSRPIPRWTWITGRFLACVIIMMIWIIIAHVLLFMIWHFSLLIYPADQEIKLSAFLEFTLVLCAESFTWIAWTSFMASLSRSVFLTVLCCVFTYIASQLLAHGSSSIHQPVVSFLQHALPRPEMFPDFSTLMNGFGWHGFISMLGYTFAASAFYLIATIFCFEKREC